MRSDRCISSLYAGRHTPPERVIEILMDAVRIRRAVETELRRYGISFALWRVLHATDNLIGESNNAVSQQAISLAIELSREPRKAVRLSARKAVRP